MGKGFLNVILLSVIVSYHCNIPVLVKLVQYNEYSVSTLDTGGLKLLYQGISCYSAEYPPMRFQKFMGYFGKLVEHCL